MEDFDVYFMGSINRNKCLHLTNEIIRK